MCSRKNHIKLRATATSPSLLPFLSPSNRSFDLTCLSSYHQGIKAWTTSAFSLAKWEKYLNLNRITLITPQKPKKNISKWFWFFLSMKTHWFLVLFFWRGGCLWEIPRTHPASSWWRRAAQHGVPFLGIFGGLWFRSSWTGFGFTKLQVRKLKSNLKNESLANENHWIWLFVYGLFPVVDFSLALIFLREFPWDQPNRPDQEISSFKPAWSQTK